MRFAKIVKLFEEGNVSVCGLKGRGKDMLMANVAIRRDKPYISNVDYGGKWIKLDPSMLNVNGNTYKNFLQGNIKPYEYPYDDGIDWYISDAGIYFPAQYGGQLDRDFAEMPILFALIRQLGDASIHTNSQSLTRVWLKIREQSDTFILARKCIYIKWLRLVIQRVTIYDSEESASRRLQPLALPKIPLLAKNRRQLELQRDTAIANHEASHGKIKSAWLIYRNKSNYNTRIFKEILKNEKDNNNNLLNSNNI